MAERNDEASILCPLGEEFQILLDNEGTPVRFRSQIVPEFEAVQNAQREFTQNMSQLKTPRQLKAEVTELVETLKAKFPEVFAELKRRGHDIYLGDYGPEEGWDKPVRALFLADFNPTNDHSQFLPFKLRRYERALPADGRNLVLLEQYSHRYPSHAAYNGGSISSFLGDDIPQFGDFEEAFRKGIRKIALESGQSVISTHHSGVKQLFASHPNAKPVAGIEPNRCIIVNGVAVVHFYHKDYLTKSGGVFAAKAGLFNDRQALLFLILQHDTPIAFSNLKDEFLAFSLAVGSNGDKSLYWVMVTAAKLEAEGQKLQDYYTNEVSTHKLDFRRFFFFDNVCHIFIFFADTGQRSKVDRTFFFFFLILCSLVVEKP